MTSRLRTGIILLICVYAVSSIGLNGGPKAPGRELIIDINMLKESIQDRQRYVNMINYLRVKAAETDQIPNMNEITWDGDLEKKAEAQTCDASPGPNYRVAFAYELKNYLRKYNRTEKEDKDNMIFSLYTEFLLPDQSKMGCAQMEKPCSGPEGDYKIACLIGPNKDEKVLEKGAPGSKCPHGKVSSGLCESPSSSATSDFSSSSMTLIIGFLYFLKLSQVFE